MSLPLSGRPQWRIHHVLHKEDRHEGSRRLSASEWPGSPTSYTKRGDVLAGVTPKSEHWPPGKTMAVLTAQG